jgi:hypothetical protein
MKASDDARRGTLNKSSYGLSEGAPLSILAENVLDDFPRDGLLGCQK